VNLSRYGVCFHAARDIDWEDAQLKLRLHFPDGRQATIGVKFLKREPLEGETCLYTSETSFPTEEVRRRVHTFLRTVPGDKIWGRRKGERRWMTASPKGDKRKTERRRNFGIFTDCVLFASRAPSWETQHTLYRQTKSTRPGRIVIKGRELISYGSTDYFGLSHHPQVKEASIKAIEKFGTGTGSRVLNGTLSLHEEFEQELAKFKHQEAALLFAGGYLANVSILTALLKEDDVVFLDEKAHASIIDGCNFSGAKITPFKHNSAEDLTKKIERAKHSRGLIVVDGVYSIEGDLACLPEIKSVAETHGIPLMVDDAHGFGFIGPNGAGTSEHFGLSGKIDLEMGTMSGALGGIGGFLACSKTVSDYLRRFSRGFLYTTSLPPAVIAGLLEALRIIKTDASLRTRLWSNVKKLKDGLRNLGYSISQTESAIISILIGNEQATFESVQILEDHGIYVSPFVRPAVKRGEARIRLTLNAVHSDEDLSKTVETFSALKPVFGRMIKSSWTA
jgi:8-amino-7-oxononanoate synthase